MSLLVASFLPRGNLGTLNDPLLPRIGELCLYIWKQVFVHVILINTVQRYFFYFIGQNNLQENGSFRTVPSFFFMIYNLYNNYLEVNIKFSTFALSLKNT